ncbi:thioredoxin fold domain-containing protein [Accumulibacter sp.]|uniref:thioredoxin family protein n=1 Tax=Accumulibacter sp. TaxID=2053492 RepID=UPI0025D86DBA|nr:thioredoxin fold domain-containing protein [Accumulibacter sp.]MCM8624382.1 thioredoxin fold domain-containing protein [Accumulibacter sp.]
MQRLAALILGTGLMVLVSPLRAELFQPAPGDLAVAVAAASRQGRVLAVLFEQEDCDNCRKLRQGVFPGPFTEKAFARRYATLAVNLSTNGELVLPDGKAASARAWAESLRVVGTPAFAFFDRRGRLLYRYTGVLKDSEELLLLGRYVAVAEYERRPFDDYVRGHKSGPRTFVPDAMLQSQVCRTRS